MRRIASLPFTTSVAIAYKSIRVRFFRSLITTMSLVLAVSFLTFTQVTTDVAQGVLSLQDGDFINKLSQMGYDILPNDTDISSSPKQRWLIFLSLLVCVVGIINAQLMSVTERFREIGTMKCLGALDKFIIRIFVIEAGIQGMAGSVMGAILGSLSAVLAGIFRFGIQPLWEISLEAVTFSILISIATGTILSLVGVLYPALIAARMQPVEAMRVEQ